MAAMGQLGEQTRRLVSGVLLLEDVWNNFNAPSKGDSMLQSRNMTDVLPVFLANSYALYLETQRCHWHVKGGRFLLLHELYQRQYEELAEAIDVKPMI